MTSGDDKAPFRRNAYLKAANAIEFCLEKITSSAQAGKLKGVGKGSMAHVDEFLEDGVMGERAKKEKAEKEGEKEDENVGDEKAVAAKTSGAKKAKAGLAFID